MSKDYLGVVIVYNLLPEDYEDDSRIKEIKKAINRGLAISPTEDNIIFSFPQDPSVKSPEIPVLVNVELWRTIPQRTGAAMRIKKALLSLPGEKRENVNVTLRGGYDPNAS